MSYNPALFLGLAQWGEERSRRAATMSRNFAHLKSDSPWYPLFSNGMVPIRYILVPKVGEMLGDGVQYYYDVDVKKLSQSQFDAIAEMVAKQCGGTAEEVAVDMHERGFIPLRAKHVSGVSSDSLAFL